MVCNIVAGNLQRMPPSIEYSARMRSVFEIVAAYFVNTFMNTLVENARAEHQSQTRGFVSFTDAYLHCTRAYLGIFKIPDLYRNMIGGIHATYIQHTRDDTITFAECVDRIVDQIMPAEYAATATRPQRDQLLQEVLKNAVTNFSRHVTMGVTIGMIADQKIDQALVRSLQDRFVAELISEREAFMHRIADAESGNTSSDAKVVEKLKSKLVDLLRTNLRLEKRVMALEAELKDHDADEQHDRENVEYKLKYEDLLAKHSELAARENVLQQSLDAARADLRQIALNASKQPSATPAPQPRRQPRTPRAPAPESYFAPQPPQQSPPQPQPQSQTQSQTQSQPQIQQQSHVHFADAPLVVDIKPDLESYDLLTNSLFASDYVGGLTNIE